MKARRTLCTLNPSLYSRFVLLGGNKTKTQVSRAKWRPGHPDQVATAQAPLMGEKDFAMMVHDITEPAIAHFALYGGDDKKNGFCWLDTPLNFSEHSGGPLHPSSALPAASSSSVSFL